jgi:hypothetical protein
LPPIFGCPWQRPLSLSVPPNLSGFVFCARLFGQFGFERQFTPVALECPAPARNPNPRRGYFPDLYRLRNWPFLDPPGGRWSFCARVYKNGEV